MWAKRGVWRRGVAEGCGGRGKAESVWRVRVDACAAVGIGHQARRNRQGKPEESEGVCGAIARADDHEEAREEGEIDGEDAAAAMLVEDA